MKHTLESIIRSGVSYDDSWGIYADDCRAEAEARIGQTAFEGGGLLDGKTLVCTGKQLGDAIQRYTDGEDAYLVDLDVDGLLQEEICNHA